MDEKKDVDLEFEGTDSTTSNAARRESDDDAGIPVVRYKNPVSIRSTSHPLWGGVKLKSRSFY